MQATLTILGSGTSMGVPTLGCTCRVCTSADPRDRRSRPSVAIEWQGHRVVIDTGPDFRAQALRESIDFVDAVFYTHAHADHILGLDDLRPLSFLHRPGSLPLYADARTIHVLERVFEYTFSPHSRYPNRARVTLEPLDADASVDLFGLRFQRIPLVHGELETGGFRFGNAAYLTDMNSIPEASLALLAGVDLVVIDALRPQPHPSHSNLEQSIEWVRRLNPRRAYFTHMSHEILHAETEAALPAPIRLAYDGLRLDFEI